MEDQKTSQGYRIYVLAILALVYFFYMVDRGAINVSQELIRKEFGLSDTQMGLLTGTFYGVAYALAGIPLGWAVDRVNRRKLIAGIVALWSGLTALAGLTASFWQLALTRIGIGAAESGGAPTSLSILADLYPPERRGAVSSIFFAGAGLGTIATYVAGGYIAQHYGWRALFLVFGIPGMLLALVLLLTLREPVRKGAPAKAGETPAAMLKQTWRLTTYPGLGALYLATGFYMLSVTGVGAWTVPFFMRSTGLDLTTIGLVLGVGSGIFGVLGQLTAGFSYDWARRFGPRGPLMVVVIGSVIHVMAMLVVLLSTNLYVTLAALCFSGATTSLGAGPTTAAISELAPPESRGTSFSLYSVISNVFGAGFGPMFVGMLSDWLGGSEGESLRTAMIAVTLLQLLAVLAYLRAASAFAKAVGDKAAKIEPTG